MPGSIKRRPGRPPAAEADETRLRIMHAARLVFSERGYDGATFQAIAERARLTRPAINHYFSSKQTLYRAVLDATNDTVLGAGINQAERETTLTARLSTFIAAAVNANSGCPAGSALLVTGILESQRHPEWSGSGNDTVRISREFLARVVNDALERGELDAETDASAMAEALLVVLFGLGLYAGYVQGYKEMSAAVERVRPILLDRRMWRPDHEGN
ncbi:helix-turn-helix domain-containing protein [Mycobacterium paraintracellulare]|uniref:TetR/AcrR family transcriptional regulator n=1 Tax=Mycobacterium paraintracellulare TaxID=1138383 RepID=UPI001EEE281C|nr:TetR/AcrR family transcriptional regulator [Mycobacterium paraintracellulare]WVL48118.1 helix-turn-helix domain-containing protein [Mycobacterium paraintracellulare]